MASIDFTGFEGIRNNVPDYRISSAELSAALNVDIDDSKRVVQRGGFTAISTSPAHSLFSNGEFCLYVSGTNLTILRPSFTTSVLLAGLSGNRMSYVSINHMVYLTDGIKAWVTDGSTISQWGITPPSRQPLARVGSGLLPSGEYQYALTFLRSGGFESGTGILGAIDAAGGIEFYDIPISSDPTVTSKAIYITSPGGKIPRRAIVLDNAVTTVTYTGNTVSTDIVLDSQFKQHAPAADHVASFNGNALVAVREFLLYSDAYQFQFFDPVRQSYQFDSRISMVAPVLDGVFVGTENAVWFLAGDDITQAQLTKIADYGVIANTLAEVDGSFVLEGMSGSVRIFVSKKGICVAGNSGSFKNLSVDKYVFPVSTSGAAVTRIRPGLNQYIATLNK